MRFALIVEELLYIKVFKHLNLLEEFMAKEKYVKGAKHHVVIGTIGHIGGEPELKSLIKTLNERDADKINQTLEDDKNKGISVRFDVEVSQNDDKSITLDNAHEEIDDLRR